MSSESEMAKIKARLENTEHALMAMWAMIQDEMHPVTQSGVDNMLMEYFSVNEDLGGYPGNKVGWESLEDAGQKEG